MNDAKSGRPTGDRQTLVEEGTEFKGTLSSNCHIIIKGKLEGDVRGPSLHVSPTGSVSGTVKVGEINSEGEIAGQCEAEAVRLSGRVKDGTVIRAKSLDMRLAPQKGKLEVTFGECELEIGDEPTKEAAAVEAPAKTDDVFGPVAAATAAQTPLPGLTRGEPAESAPKADGSKGGKASGDGRASAPTSR